MAGARCDIAAELLPPDGCTRPLKVAFIYDKTDPWAISMHVATARGTVRWSFARDLLRNALERGWAGLGDVRLDADTVAEPEDAERFLLSLNSPSGSAVLVFRRTDLDRLLTRTYRIVPGGAERIDWTHEERHVRGAA